MGRGVGRKIGGGEMEDGLVGDVGMGEMIGFLFSLSSFCATLFPFCLLHRHFC